MKLRLRAIVQGADFRKTELTSYEEFRKRKDYPGDLKPGQSDLLISRGGSQLVWVMRYEAGVLVGRTKRRRIESIRMRVSGGSWNPAKACGIELQGLKRFEETYKKSRERKQAKHVG
jgi:hypothetical protein